MSESEVAQIRRQIQAEYEAAKQGLSGFASGTARHDFIQIRTEAIGRHHEKLVELLGPEQAISIIANTLWSPTDQGTIS
jgi:hypothetical protein